MEALFYFGGRLTQDERDHLLIQVAGAEYTTAASVATMLIACGCDANATSITGESALQLTLGQLGIGFACALLRAGADPNVAAAGLACRSPLLHWAVRSPTPDVASLLVDHGARVDAADANGDSAIDAAVRVEQINPSSVEVVWRAGCPCERSAQLLKYVVEWGRCEFATDLLVEYGHIVQPHLSWLGSRSQQIVDAAPKRLARSNAASRLDLWTAVECLGVALPLELQDLIVSACRPQSVTISFDYDGPEIEW